MAAKVIYAVIRTLIGLGLIAGGLAIEFLQYFVPMEVESVRTGNALVGPFIAFVGAIVTFWPAVKWFYREMEKQAAEWREPAKRSEQRRGENARSADADLD